MLDFITILAPALSALPTLATGALAATGLAAAGALATGAWTDRAIPASVRALDAERDAAPERTARPARDGWGRYAPPMGAETPAARARTLSALRTAPTAEGTIALGRRQPAVLRLTPPPVRPARPTRAPAWIVGPDVGPGADAPTLSAARVAALRPAVGPAADAPALSAERRAALRTAA